VSAECWFSLGLSTILTGDPETGGGYLARSLELARAAHDDRLVVAALRMIVHGLLDSGQIEAAESFAAESLRVANSLPMSWQKGAALGTLGMVHRAKGDHDRAAGCFQQEMAAWRATGDTWMLAASASDAAEAELKRGNIALARSLTTEMLTLVDTHDAPTLAWNLDILGRTLAAAGCWLSAVRMWGAAELVYERTGLKPPRYMADDYERAVAAARTAINDDTAFVTAWREGRTMSPANAVAQARVEA
jgi:hypothetical protein